MSYVAIALSAEGQTDEAFLWPIIYRVALSVAANAVIGETPFFIARGANSERIAQFRSHAEEFDIFVVHADATRTALPRIKASIIDAIRAGAVRSCEMEETRIVGLITVGEMESWPLISPDAIAGALGFERWPASIALTWNPRDVETLPDPKRILDDAVTALLRREPDRQTLHETLEGIASRMPLDALETLSSFRAFRDDLIRAMSSLRVLARPTP